MRARQSSKITISDKLFSENYIYGQGREENMTIGLLVDHPKSARP